MSLRSIYNSVPSINTTNINVPNLTNLFENTRVTEWNQHGQAQIRQGIRDEISKIFDKVYFSITSFIDSTTASELGIECKRLRLLPHGGNSQRQEHFFKSRPSNWLVLHPVDPEDRKTAGLIASINREWQNRIHNVGGNYSEAEMVSAALGYAFRLYERIAPFDDARSEDGTRDCADSYTLEEISGWVHLEKNTRLDKGKYMQPTPLPKPESRDEAPGPDSRANINPAAFEWSRLADAWMRDDSKPHRVFLLEHASHPEKELLRSEVLTVLGMIRERLAGHTLREHKIAPVMLISCMNGFAARIVQGHYSEGKLVLYKSDLFYFNIAGYREANIELFLRYLGSEPVGDTVS